MGKVTKYPKYKQEAYSRLVKLFKGILEETEFYTKRPELKSDGLVFSYDPSDNINGQFTVSVRGITLLKVHGRELKYSIPNGIRSNLSREERQLVVKNLNTIFSVGQYMTVNNYIGDLRTWYISSEICRFCSIFGDTYINSKSYKPTIVAKTIKPYN